MIAVLLNLLGTQVDERTQNARLILRRCAHPPSFVAQLREHRAEPTFAITLDML